MSTGYLKTKSTFYLQPAFRYKTFVGATLMVLLDLLLAAVTLARRWSSLPPVVVFLLCLSICSLVILWLVAFGRQRFLYGLVQSGRIEKPEPRSGLDIALSVASDMTDWSLFAACIAVGALTEALGELSRLH